MLKFVKNSQKKLENGFEVYFIGERMNLIVTLGATSPKFKHKYFLDGKEYNEWFSFLAIKKHYNISDKDIIILGTKKTKDVLRDMISNYRLEILKDDDIEYMFQKSIELIEKDTILDVTQSFRLISFAPFLASNIANSLNKSVEDILYAQVLDGDNPTQKECKFRFLSLKRYQDIGDLIKVINSFVNSFYVEKVDIDEFNEIYQLLHTISKKLLSNDTAITNDIKMLITLLLKEKDVKFRFLKEYFELLEKEIKKLNEILYLEEYKKFFRLSQIYLEKGLLLQSLTFLFESVTAYLEFIADKRYIKCKKSKNIFVNKNEDIYKWRNCLKSMFSRFGCKFKFGDIQIFKIQNCKEFQNNLKKIDHMRNDSAHVFIKGKSIDDIKDEIESLIKFFGDYLDA